VSDSSFSSFSTADVTGRETQAFRALIDKDHPGKSRFPPAGVDLCGSSLSSPRLRECIRQRRGETVAQPCRSRPSNAVTLHTPCRVERHSHAGKKPIPSHEPSDNARTGLSWSILLSGLQHEQASIHDPENANLRRPAQPLPLFPGLLVATVDLIKVFPEALRSVVA